MPVQVEYKGNTFWISIEPTTHKITGETGFIAFVNNQEPGGLLWGNTVKDPEGRTIFFGDEISALTNARAVIESY
jgi:hypothetical protein